MSNNLSLNQVLFQDALRSKPVRDNFDEIQTEFNSLRTEVASIVSSSTTLTEVINAREIQPSLKDNLLNIRTQISPSGYYAIGLFVTQDTGSNMKVKAQSGSGFVSGSAVYKSGTTTSGTITSPAATKQRYDAVVIDSSSNITIKTGAEVVSSPELPTIATGEMLLAHFLLTSATTAITDSMIIDDRPVMNPQTNRGICITNQTQFEWWFGTGLETGTGTTSGGWSFSETGGVVTVIIPANTSISLFPCQFGGTTSTHNGLMGYLLKTITEVKSNVSIIGYNEATTIIAKNSEYTYFTSTGTSGTHITDINFLGWTFDGRKSSYVKNGNGGFIELMYVDHANFDIKIINCSCGGGGGAISGNPATYIYAIKIYSCVADIGGGVSGCSYSTITAHLCDAVYGLYSQGGGAHSCQYSTIKAYGCTADISNGGGAYNCTDCISIWSDTGSIDNCSLGGNRQS